MLEIAKATKAGQLDTDKIEGFQSLIRNYRPNVPPTKQEIEQYIDGLFEFGNFIPTDKKDWLEHAQLNFSEEDKEQCSKVYGGWDPTSRMYDELVKDAFWGACAMLALGGKWLRKDRDTTNMEDYKKLKK